MPIRFPCVPRSRCSAGPRPARAAGASRFWATCWSLAKQGQALHAELAEAVDEANVDVLYAAGPLMAHLWEKTPPERRGAYAETSAELKDSLLDGLHAGDVVMIKGRSAAAWGRWSKP